MKNIYSEAVGRVLMLRHKMPLFEEVPPVEHIAQYMRDNWGELIDECIKEGDDLSLDSVYELAACYIKFSGLARDIPWFLSSIARSKNVDLPAEPGLLTAEYWDSRISTVDMIDYIKSTIHDYAA